MRGPPARRSLTAHRSVSVSEEGLGRCRPAVVEGCGIEPAGIQAAAGGAKRRLRVLRKHWDIENRVHWVKDVTFDEDRSQVRTGNAPQVMAAFRNLTSTLVRWAGHTNVAPALRRHAAHVSEAFALMGIDPHLTQE